LGGRLGGNNVTDTDATITIGPCSSTDLGRLAASLDYLTLFCREPGADEAGQHQAGEAVAEHEQLLVGAVTRAVSFEISPRDSAAGGGTASVGAFGLTA
jgi:hypothetical protein